MSSFNLLSMKDKMGVLHYSWVAFFITFLIWFNHAPLLQAIGVSLDLTSAQLKTLLTLNVAMAIPARVLIGMLTDRYGPRLVYSLLLAVCSIPCLMFAMADSYDSGLLGQVLWSEFDLSQSGFRQMSWGSRRVYMVAGGTSDLRLQRLRYRRLRCCLLKTGGAGQSGSRALLAWFIPSFFIDRYVTHPKVQPTSNRSILVPWR